MYIAMSRSVNIFFKKSQAVKQPHFIHDTKKCRFIFASLQMQVLEKNTEYNLVPSPGPFSQNSENQIILCKRLDGISKMADIVVEQACNLTSDRHLTKNPVYMYVHVCTLVALYTCVQCFLHTLRFLCYAHFQCLREDTCTPQRAYFSFIVSGLLR